MITDSGVFKRKKKYTKAEEGKLTTSILESPAPVISGMPSSIQDIINRALMKDRRDRFDSAREMFDALKDVWQSSTEEANADVPSNEKLKSIKEWTVDEVVLLFKKCNFDHVISVILEDQIDGKTLLSLSDDDLMESVSNGGIGLRRLQVKRLRSEIQAFQDAA